MIGFSGMLFFEVKGGWVEVIRFVEVREGSFEFIVKKFWGIFFGFLVIFVFYLVKKKVKKRECFICWDIGFILKVIILFLIF